MSFLSSFLGQSRSLKKHIEGSHNPHLNVQDENRTFPILPIAANVMDVSHNSVPTDVPVEISYDRWLKDLLSGDAGKNFLLNLLSSSSMSLAQTFNAAAIVNETFDTFISFLNDMLLKIELEEPSVVQSSSFTQLRQILKDLSFCDIDNEYSLMKNLLKCANFVEPITVVLGGSHETRYVNGFPQQVYVERSAQFVPFSSVLRRVILVHDEVFDECLKYEKLLDRFSSISVVIDQGQLCNSTLQYTGSVDVQSGKIIKLVSILFKCLFVNDRQF